MDGFDIIRLQNITYVNSKIVSAYIELEAMKTTNQERLNNGQALAWDESAFISLIDKYQLGHNSILANLNNGL